MFDGYSIAVASQPHDLYIMDEDVSPTSSRATTPAPEAIDMSQLEFNTDTIAELSNRFRQHRLDPYAHKTDDLTLSSPVLDIEPPTHLILRIHSILKKSPPQCQNPHCISPLTPRLEHLNFSTSQMAMAIQCQRCLASRSKSMGISIYQHRIGAWTQQQFHRVISYPV